MAYIGMAFHSYGLSQLWPFIVMAYIVVVDIVMAYIVMADMVMAFHRYGLYSHGLYVYGLYSYGLYLKRKYRRRPWARSGSSSWRCFETMKSFRLSCGRCDDYGEASAQGFGIRL